MRFFSRHWEFRYKKDMLNLLIGNYLGANPENRIPEVKAFKKECASLIMNDAKMNKEDVVLEIGSGCGYMSSHIALRVKRLYCCDISKSFLKFAKRECRRIDNISFHKIVPYSFSFNFLDPYKADVVFAHNIFIHLDLFDIFWYLKEIDRVLKSGGRLWFDMVNAETLNPQDPCFLEMANSYKKSNLRSWPTLMKWNSSAAVIAIAEYFGFKLEKFEFDKHYLFIKQ